MTNLKNEKIEHIIKGFAGSWHAYAETNGIDKKDDMRIKYPPITISRGFGSGGRILAEKLAEKLNYKLYDKEIIDIIAKEKYVSSDLVQCIDEGKLTNIQLWIQSFFKDTSIDQDEYVPSLVKVVKTLSEMGKAIFLGRASNIIVGCGNGLRIRIVQNLEARTQNLCRYEKYSEADAKKEITQSDKDRKYFIKTYFNKDIDDVLNYDLVINRSCFPDIASMANIVIAAYNEIKIRMAKS